MFEVLLKAGHPTGSYRRAGMEFGRGQPVKMPTVPQAVRDDTWLVVTEMKAEADGNTAHASVSPIAELSKPRRRREAED